MLTYREEHRAERVQRASNHAEDREKEIEADCTYIANTHSFRCVINSPETDQKVDYAKADLRAQQEMAESALVMVFISGAGLVITVVGIVFVAFTLQTALEANRIAREQFARENRAWLDVKVEFTDPQWLPPQNATFLVVVTAKNVGSGPATNIYFDIPPISLKVFTGKELQAFRQRIGEHRLAEHEIGDTVFKDGECTRTSLIVCELSEAGHWGGEFILPVYVSYDIGSDTVRHITPVIKRIILFGSNEGKPSQVSDDHPLSIAPD